MADAAHAVLTGTVTYPSGTFLIDEDVLARTGVRDLASYRYSNGNEELQLDLYL